MTKYLIVEGDDNTLHQQYFVKTTLSEYHSRQCTPKSIIVVTDIVRHLNDEAGEFEAGISLFRQQSLSEHSQTPIWDKV